MSDNTRWRPFTKGGYSEIFINDQTIRKVMTKYNSSDDGNTTINVSAFSELCFLASIANHIPGVPRISNYTVNDTRIVIDMPFYGNPLHYKKIPKQRVRYVATQLIESLLYLDAYNVQHTDLKPGNVLVSPNDQRVTLIDFNNMSKRVKVNGTVLWTKGYGTWYCCAPEIVHTVTPSDTSMIWSFGILLAYMYAGYPASHLLHKGYKVGVRSYWKRMYKQLCADHPDGLPLSPKHVAAMPTDLLHLYYMCVKWDPYERCTIDQALHILQSTTTYCINMHYVATKLNQLSAISLIYTACRDSQTMFVFFSTLYIFHEIIATGISIPSNELMCISHCISLLNYGDDEVFDDSMFMNQMRSVYHITTDMTQIQADVWTVCDALQWNIFGNLRDAEKQEVCAYLQETFPDNYHILKELV